MCGHTHQAGSRIGFQGRSLRKTNAMAPSFLGNDYAQGYAPNAANAAKRPATSPRDLKTLLEVVEPKLLANRSIRAFLSSYNVR